MTRWLCRFRGQKAAVKPVSQLLEDLDIVPSASSADFDWLHIDDVRNTLVKYSGNAIVVVAKGSSKIWHFSAKHGYRMNQMKFSCSFSSALIVVSAATAAKRQQPLSFVRYTQRRQSKKTQMRLCPTASTGSWKRLTENFHTLFRSLYTVRDLITLYISTTYRRVLAEQICNISLPSTTNCHCRYGWIQPKRQIQSTL